VGNVFGFWFLSSQEGLKTKPDKLNPKLPQHPQLFYTEELQEKKMSFTEKNNSVKLFFESFFSLCKNKRSTGSAVFCEISAVFCGKQKLRRSEIFRVPKT
jgi:hypothetical protein